MKEQFKMAFSLLNLALKIWGGDDTGDRTTMREEGGSLFSSSCTSDLFLFI